MKGIKSGEKKTYDFRSQSLDSSKGILLIKPLCFELYRKKNFSSQRESRLRYLQAVT